MADELVAVTPAQACLAAQIEEAVENFTWLWNHLCDDHGLPPNALQTALARVLTGAIAQLSAHGREESNLEILVAAMRERLPSEMRKAATAEAERRRAAGERPDA